MSSTFPEKLIFDGKNSRTPSLNEVLHLALAADKGFRRQKTGQLSENLEISGLVENIVPLIPKGISWRTDDLFPAPAMGWSGACKRFTKG